MSDKFGMPIVDCSPESEVRYLTQKLAAAEARIAELEAQGRQDISVWFDTTATHNTNVELRQQLAALQALLQKKDEALGWIAKTAFDGGVMDAARKALSLTSPTDALAPYLRCVEVLEQVKGLSAATVYPIIEAALAAVKGGTSC